MWLCLRGVLVPASHSSSQGIRKLFLPRIRPASQLIRAVADLLTCILSFLSGEAAQYFYLFYFFSMHNHVYVKPPIFQYFQPFDQVCIAHVIFCDFRKLNDARG